MNTELDRTKIINIGRQKTYPRLIKKLDEILKFYNIKYNLKVSINYGTFMYGIYYVASINQIYYDFFYLIRNFNTIKKYSHYLAKSKKDCYIFILLHEIGHAYDNKFNKKEFEFDSQNKNIDLWNKSYEYRVSYPTEQRATSFALQEIERWI